MLWNWNEIEKNITSYWHFNKIVTLKVTAVFIYNMWVNHTMSEQLKEASWSGSGAIVRAWTAPSWMPSVSRGRGVVIGVALSLVTSFVWAAPMTLIFWGSVVRVILFWSGLWWPALTIHSSVAVRVIPETLVIISTIFIRIPTVSFLRIKIITDHRVAWTLAQRAKPLTNKQKKKHLN